MPRKRKLKPKPIAPPSGTWQEEAFWDAMGWDAWLRQRPDPLLEELRQEVAARARAARRAIDKDRRAARRLPPKPALPPRQMRRRVAAELLWRELRAGSWKRAERVLLAAERKGVSRNTLQRAKAALAIETRRVGWGRGSHIEWRLPQARKRRS